MKNQSLQPLILLSQFSQWSGVVLFVSICSFIAFILFGESTSGHTELALQVAVLATLFIPFVLFLGASLLPSFSIFRELTSLLKKYRDHDLVNLSEQSEVRKLRKLLLLQLGLNVVGQFLIARQGTSIVAQKNIPDNMAKYVHVLEKAMNVQSYAACIYFSSLCCRLPEQGKRKDAGGTR